MAIKQMEARGIWNYVRQEEELKVLASLEDSDPLMNWYPGV